MVKGAGMDDLSMWMMYDRRSSSLAKDGATKDMRKRKGRSLRGVKSVIAWGHGIYE